MSYVLNGAVVHGGFGSSIASPQSFGFSSTVVSGSLLVLLILDNNGGNNNVTSVTDSQGNTWTRNTGGQQVSGTTGFVYHTYTVEQLTNTDTVTVAWNGGSWGGFGLDVVSFAGADTLQAATYASGPPASLTAGSGDLLVGGHSGSSGSSTPAGWSNAVAEWNTQRGWMHVDYKLAAAAGSNSYSPSGTGLTTISGYLGAAGGAAWAQQKQRLNQVAVQNSAL